MLVFKILPKSIFIKKDEKIRHVHQENVEYKFLCNALLNENNSEEEINDLFDKNIMIDNVLYPLNYQPNKITLNFKGKDIELTKICETEGDISKIIAYISSYINLLEKMRKNNIQSRFIDNSEIEIMNLYYIDPKDKLEYPFVKIKHISSYSVHILNEFLKIEIQVIPNYLDLDKLIYPHNNVSQYLAQNHKRWDYSFMFSLTKTLNLDFTKFSYVFKYILLTSFCTESTLFRDAFNNSIANDAKIKKFIENNIIEVSDNYSKVVGIEPKKYQAEYKNDILFFKKFHKIKKMIDEIAEPSALNQLDQLKLCYFFLYNANMYNVSILYLTLKKDMENAKKLISYTQPLKMVQC